MENLFLKALDNSMSNKRTENGALSFNSSGNPVLDLFALGGAYRSRSDEDILALWRKAYAESPLDALLVLFYIRAAREGIGEKRFFRVAFADFLKSGKLNNEAAAELIALVPEAGSWKDLVSEPVFSSSPLVGEIIVKQLLLDSASDAPSLLAKWIPCGRGNESAKRETKRFSSLFSMSEKNYRKLVVGIRRKLSLVETRMAENRWNDIEYDKIPSKAGLKYTAAFRRHDDVRYSEFINAVKDGSRSVNMSLTMPYEIVSRVLYKDDEAAEAFWKNLPDFVRKDERAIAVVDISGSMFVHYLNPWPVTVSVSLGIYFADRLTGPFGKRFITFSDNPRLVSLEGALTLREKVQLVLSEDNVGYNTDIGKVFSLILKAAIESDAKPDEMPETLYVISDMEFDEAANPAETNFEEAERIFAENGYRLPSVVFWNVAARNNTIPVKSWNSNVSLVSGCSPSVFSIVFGGKTPLDVMNETVRKLSFAERILALPL